MAHAKGWIEAYEHLEKGEEISSDLLNIILKNKSSLGETMLHWYAIEGEPHTLEKIINLGFDVNTQNDFGQTPLFECVSTDRWDNVKVLLEHGARADIKNENDVDIWQYLEEMGKSDKIKKLKELIANS